MDKNEFAEWARSHNVGEEIHCKKDQVFVLSCGTKTYTWFIKSGVVFTTQYNPSTDRELANTIWRKNDMVHSFDEDIMLPLHALTDAVLIRYPSDEFNRQVHASAELSWHLARHYHDQFTNTLSNYRHAALDSSEDHLDKLEERFLAIEELKDDKVSDATLALFMGVHRVSVSRIRKKLLEKRGQTPKQSWKKKS